MLFLFCWHDITVIGQTFSIIKMIKQVSVKTSAYLDSYLNCQSLSSTFIGQCVNNLGTVLEKCSFSLDEVLK